MEFVSGLVGALIGGSFVLIGSLIQGRQQMNALREQFVHERKLAGEQFERERVASENERLTDAVRELLGWADRVPMAIGRAILRFQDCKDEAERRAAVIEVQQEFGADPAGYNPFLSLVRAEELEDPQLASTVGSLRESIEDTWTNLVLFSHRDPDCLPDSEKYQDSVGRQRAGIELRLRALRRLGRPL